MRNDGDDENPVELGDAFAGRVPDPGTEDEVVALLRAEGLLKGRPRTALSLAWRVAAGLVLFTGGWISSSVANRVATPPEAGPPGVVAGGVEAYMLLIREGPDYVEERVPGERTAEYGTWARTIVGEGIPVSGEELGPASTMLPPLELADASEPTRISGFFIVETDSARAAELARTHPHRTYGGWVEVRPVVR